MGKSIHDGHRERLRAKILNHGMQVLADHEKLEYLLYPFVPRRDTNPIAHDLIRAFGSLKRVLDADVEDLIAIKGVSRNAALFLHSLPALFSSYASSAPKTIFGNLDQAARYAIQTIGQAPIERFVCFFLRKSGEVIKILDLAEGAQSAVVLNRENFVRIAVQCKAHVVILSHNHPSGSLNPSKSDIESTIAIAKALEIVGIRLWDHLIVSATDWYSICNNKENKTSVENDSEKESDNSVFYPIEPADKFRAKYIFEDEEF